MTGYHKREIIKGTLGQASKIREELEEFEDALDQKCKIMALLELSDLVGAVDSYLGEHHPSIKLGDLIDMSYITSRAFRSGERT